MSLVRRKSLVLFLTLVVLVLPPFRAARAATSSGSVTLTFSPTQVLPRTSVAVTASGPLAVKARYGYFTWPSGAHIGSWRETSTGTFSGRAVTPLVSGGQYIVRAVTSAGSLIAQGDLAIIVVGKSKPTSTPIRTATLRPTLPPTQTPTATATHPLFHRARPP